MQVTYGLFDAQEQAKWAQKIARVTDVVGNAKGSVAVFELKQIANEEVIQSELINSAKLLDLVIDVPDDSFDAIAPSLIKIAKELIKWMVFHFEKLTPDATAYSEEMAPARDV